MHMNSYVFNNIHMYTLEHNMFFATTFIPVMKSKLFRALEVSTFEVFPFESLEIKIQTH